MSAWQPVTRTEMRAIVGLVLTMGMVKMPALKDYWSESTNGLLDTPKYQKSDA